MQLVTCAEAGLCTVLAGAEYVSASVSVADSELLLGSARRFKLSEAP